MPEFTVKEVRMPELHLPEINRDDIVRTLSGVHLPEVDLARARRATFKIPTMTLTANDVGRLVAAGAAITRFVRPTPTRIRAPRNLFGRRSRSPVAMITGSRSRRSRGPILLGVLVVAVVGIWALLRRPAVQRRLETAGRDARERFETWRAQDLRPVTETDDDADAMPSASASAATEASLGPTADAGPISHEDLATHGAATNGAPAFEESQTPG
jgi:type II secretory pathway component PulM